MSMFPFLPGLHGSAESLLTITNLLIVLGLRQGIREASELKRLEEENNIENGKVDNNVEKAEI